MNQKKKTSYETKKEKLLAIKNQIEKYYAYSSSASTAPLDERLGSIWYDHTMILETLVDIIWEIVKDEKAK